MGSKTHVTHYNTRTHTRAHTNEWADRHTHKHTHTLVICETVIRVPSNNYRVHTHYTCCMYVLLTSHPGNTVQHMPTWLRRSGMYQVRYCPRARSITHLLHARLGYQHFFHSFFVVAVLGVKVRTILCDVGPAERAISRNMDRSRMSGIGKLHDDGHVPCNNGMYKMYVIIMNHEKKVYTQTCTLGHDRLFRPVSIWSRAIAICLLVVNR